MSLDLGDLVGYIKLDDKGFDDTLGKLPDKMRGSGKKLLGVGLIVGTAVAAALISGITDAMNFDATNDLVAAQLGLTAVESGRVGALAGTLYADAYGESMEQVQGTVGGVITQIEGMGTASDATVEAMTAKVLNYSTAFSVDTADAIGLVQQLMSSGLAPTAEAAMDLMTTAMQKVPEALRGDMTDAITEYGPLLAGMGFSGEEAFDVLARGAEKGMYGIDKGGDALKEFGIRATDMSKASAGAYDALGLSQEEMTAALLAGGDTGKAAFDKIVSGLSGMTDPVAQSQAALALFGTPLEDLGVTEIPNFLASLGDLGGGFSEAGGAADKMGDQLNGNAATSMKEVTRQVELIFASIGEKLLPVLSAVFGYLANNEGVMYGIIAVLGFLALAFIGVTVATWAMNTALLANPITWIVLAVVALIAALVMLVMNWDSVVAWITEVWGGFISWIAEVMNGLGTFLSEAGTNMMNGLRDGITAGWEAVVAFFTGIPGFLLDCLAAAGEWLLEVGHLILVGLATGIAMGFIAIVYMFTQFPTDLLTWLAGAAAWLVQTGTDILNGLRSGITTGWQAVVTFFTLLPGAVLGFLATAATWLVTTGRSALDGLGRGISAGWTAVVTFFTQLPSKVVAFLSGAGSWLVSAGSTLISGMLNGVTNGWGAFMGFLRGIPDTIKGALSGASSWLVSAGKNIVEGLLDGVRSLAGTVGSFFLGLLPGWIVGPFKAALGIHSPSRLFAEFGRNTIQGYLNGIEDLQPALDAKMGEVVLAPEVQNGGAGAGATSSQAPAYTASSTLTINGNVGWDAEEVAQQTTERQRQAAALAGLNDLVGVA